MRLLLAKTILLITLLIHSLGSTPLHAITLSDSLDLAQTFATNLYDNVKGPIRGGVAGTLNSTAFGGYVMGYEALWFDDSVALYCAPGLTFGNDISLGASSSGIITFGCEKNPDYTGNFLTISFGFHKFFYGVGISYSWGANFDLWLQNLEQMKKQRVFRPENILAEFLDYLTWVEKREVLSDIESLALQKIMCFTTSYAPQTHTGLEMFCQNIENNIDIGGPVDLQSAEGQENFINNPQIRQQLTLNPLEIFKKLKKDIVQNRAKERFGSVFAFFESFSGGVFTGCNSFTFGWGVSLSPSWYKWFKRSYGVTITHYALVEEIKGVPQSLDELPNEFAEYIAGHKGCWDSIQWMNKDFGVGDFVKATTNQSSNIGDYFHAGRLGQVFTPISRDLDREGFDLKDADFDGEAE